MNARSLHRWFIAYALLGACGSSGAPPATLVQNPMIEMWCGAHPCAWTTRGETQRIGTWHPDDYAIELVGAEAAVTQLNASVNEQKSRCYAFSLTADISKDAEVYLELDFLNDGKLELSEQLPELHWERKTFDITPPTWYQGVRFIVRKAKASGHVVVAALDVVDNGFNCDAPPLTLTDRPAGARCENDDQCKLGRCTGSTCGGPCKNVSECEAGEVCGHVLGRELVVDACTPLGTLRFGAVCSFAEQCESGACSDGICSECVAGSACDDGSQCLPSKIQLTVGSPQRGLPYQCSPGRQLREAGDLCTSGDDCVSGSCDGASLGCALHSCISAQSSCSAQCIQSLVVPGMCR